MVLPPGRKEFRLYGSHLTGLAFSLSLHEPLFNELFHFEFQQELISDTRAVATLLGELSLCLRMQRRQCVFG